MPNMNYRLAMDSLQCADEHMGTIEFAPLSAGSGQYHQTGNQSHVSDFALRFFANHDDETPLAPCPVTEELITLYIKAAKEKTAHLALVWPGSLSLVPLLHSLACFRRWDDGYKRGVRGLYYPAKRNSFYPLNHIFVSRSKLLELANRIIEPCSGPKNPLIREGLLTKDSFLFAVNSVKQELAEASLRPSINELLPHFLQEAPEQAWPSYADHFYSRLKSKLAVRKQGKALRNCTFPELGTAPSAPDALFALGYRLSRESLETTLKGLRKTALPDVVLIDATRQAMQSIDGLLQRIVEFITQLRAVFKEQCPGILVTMDDPRQMNLLQAALMDTEEDGPTSRRLAQHGFLFTPIGFGLTAEGNAPALKVPDCKIRAVVTDFEVGKLINQFYLCAKRLEAQGQNASAVWGTINFLAKVSHLPGGSRDLMDELQRRDAPAQAIAAFDWLHCKVPLLEFLRNGEALAERALLEKLLEQADQLMERQRDHTPLSLRVLTELEMAANTGQSTAVVVRSSLHRNVLQAVLRRSALPPDRVADNRLLMTKQLAAQGDPVEAERLIYADINATVLRDIVCGSFAGHDMVLVLTAPMAVQLKHTITPLLQIPEFAVFHKRLAAILQDIEGQFHAAGVSLLDDLEFRQASFKLATYDDIDPSVSDAEAVLVALDNDLILRRGRHSYVYTYEPLHASDGHSGFHAIPVEELEVGQQVFVMSSELRELIEAVLQDKGFLTSKQLLFEQGLRMYHERVKTQVNAIFHGNQAAQARMLQDKMIRRDSSLASELNNIRYWLNLGHSLDTPFDKLAPQAPRKFKPFYAFCKELRFQDSEIHWFWDFVIRPLRGMRRKDGRWLSDIYARILFDPESAIAYMGLNKDTIDDLRRRALSNVFTVSEVVLPNLEE